MPAAPMPNTERRRLEILAATALLDTRAEFFFEEAIDAVLSVVPAPMAAVSLVDEERQWFKARRGLRVSETPRDCAFCAYSILGESPLAVPDARQDARFSDNLLVVEYPHIVAYLGAPIILSNGFHIGSVCVIDVRPRDWTHPEIDHLRKITGLVARYIDLRTALLATNRQRYMDLAMNGEKEPPGHPWLDFLPKQMFAGSRR